MSGESLSFLNDLEQVIATRRDADPKSSYTASLFAAGVPRIAQKVGEEGLEVALAAVQQDDQAIIAETADLIYHALVLLSARGLTLAAVIAELQNRHKH